MLPKTFLNKCLPCLRTTFKYVSTTRAQLDIHRCKLLIVGGGSGGCVMAAKFSKVLKKEELIVVDPSDVHYYQPLFTFIGGGVKKFEESRRTMQEVLPKAVKWIKDEVVEFSPRYDMVTISNGDTIMYEFMVVAVGMQVNYNEIPGLIEALTLPDSGVCSNYSAEYVNLTFKAVQKFISGNAVFSFPNTAVKCAGAPQKICYIAEHYFRKVGKRNKANFIYNTSLPVLFAVKTYADALWPVVRKRNINVNLRTNLIEIKPQEKVAVFENLDKPEEKTTIEYSMLHVPPPMGPPDVLKKCSVLVTEEGYVNVNKDTLQHVKFPNIFTIGDCSCTPNSKTVAAIAAQSLVVYKNMEAAMNGQQLSAKYNGYTACPLITEYGSCILAEFDYDHNILETLPIRQDKELWVPYFLTKTILPPIYWHVMLKGNWNGPEKIRNLLHLKFLKYSKNKVIRVYLFFFFILIYMRASAAFKNLFINELFGAMALFLFN